MISTAKKVNEYLEQVADEKKDAFVALRNTIIKNIPKGFSEIMAYGMISYVVPHTAYPKGYHCDPKLPLMFCSIAAQKNFVALYHMGIYANPKLLSWFVDEYPKHCKTKLDMGKSCIRFKKMDDIPIKLISELMKKMTVTEWINLYETNYTTHLKNK